MAPFVPLDEMISGSDDLHEVLAGHIGSFQIEVEHRGDLAIVLATVAIEHAQSILLLISEGRHSSALALVRVQFEALLRGFWLYFAASDAAVARCVAPVPPGATKEPDLFPTVTDMLARIDGKAPATAVRAMTEFKAAAWGAMNSFTHGNLRVLAGQRNGYHPGLLSQTIQNSNGAAMFATMLLGQAANRADLLLAAVAMSRTHARYLPPFKPMPAAGTAG